MAKIYIKVTRDPLTVDEAIGRRVKDIFEDASILGTQIVRIRDWSGYKSDIRSVIMEPERIYPTTPNEEEQGTPEQKAKLTAFFAEMRERLKAMRLN